MASLKSTIVDGTLVVTDKIRIKALEAYSSATTTTSYTLGGSGYVLRSTSTGAYWQYVSDSSSAGAISSSNTYLVTERDVYHGLPTINGGHSYNSSTNYYVAAATGTSGQVLTWPTSGNTPTWTTLGPQLPTGGVAGDALVKHSATDGDAIWQTVASANTAGAIVKRDANGCFNAGSLSIGTNEITVQGINGTTGLRFIQHGGTAAGTITWDGTKFTISGTVATSISGSAGSATYASSYLANRASVSGSSHAVALQNYFNSYKSTEPRDCLVAHYSSAYSNGSLCFGYFLSGYDSGPYGGFFVAHYNTPYYVGILGGTYTQSQLWKAGDSVTGAVWNDYAEYRTSDCTEPGRVVFENGDDTLSMTTKRLQHFAGITSDTWGFAQGETETAKTPLAVAGRVLAYTYRDRNEYKPGDVVCAAPNGTVDIMSREEIIQYPDRIVGTVSCVPEYETWGKGDRDPVQVNNRIWIKVR